MVDFGLRLKLHKVEHLCLRVGASTKEFEYFHLHKAHHVNRFEKRSSSKTRTLYAPQKNYKHLLRKINKSLLTGTYPPGVFGGVKGRQVRDVAEIHCGKEAILSVDLKNFFPSITRDKVLTMFLRSGCSPSISSLLADLVTFDGILPQGFPTSTAIANWIAFDLDLAHLHFCKQRDIARTRWVDDITFSGRHEILRDCISSLIGAVGYHGFRLSNRKTTFAPRKHCSKVLGLNVSGAVPRVPEGSVKRILSILDDCRNLGPELAASMHDLKGKDLNASLQGHIRYIERFNPTEGRALRVILESIDM